MSKAQLKRKTFKNNDFYLPVTMKQFEELTNEILIALNSLTGPEDEKGEKIAFDADYTAQILMSVIHSTSKKEGIANKLELFESCVNSISKHVTYHVVQQIQEKLKANVAASDLTKVPLQAIEGEDQQALANGQTAH